MQQLAQLLTPARTLCQAPGISRKRLFETIASVIAQDQLSLPSEDIFSQLIAREKLGSTGLGKGIGVCVFALSHERTPSSFVGSDREGPLEEAPARWDGARKPTVFRRSPHSLRRY